MSSAETLEALKVSAGPRRATQIYACGCKGRLWYLQGDGRVRCASCLHLSRTIRIVRSVP